ncbi:type II secretion system protein E [Pseudomonas sp. FFUP_PS_473]|uniref:GspE/PulE family protein n=1 Tax=Pseudomonas sp. FFUP_PS_473 TaxID=2060418 RepID=UPI000C7C77E3|nr:GspE/PulE family protein [Pseudomonas sp. FFUP_PS_473]PLP93087.1 type II secretion system protein E [Pseudomonas sp. FFUP_PS_473]
MPALAEDRPLDLVTLLDALVAQHVIHAEDAQRVVPTADDPDHPLEVIARRRLPDARQPGQVLELEGLCQWLAADAGQPYLCIDPMRIDAAHVTALMSAAFAQRHGILAVAVDADSVTVASAQPFVRSWESDLAHVLKRQIKRVIASPERIRNLSREFFNVARSVNSACQLEIARPAASIEHLLDLGTAHQEADANDTHIVSIVDWLLQYAFEQRASDIHIEPRREQGGVRFRIDGVLHEAYRFPPWVTLAAISRLKSLGRMNVAEKRRPQDGRLKTRTPAGSEVEIRLSTLPTTFGEKLVLRIFDPELLQRDFQQLGLVGDELACWQRMLGHNHGIVLVTGPTGSGKTSTLYASLKQLATPEVNLCTLEDPIEMVEPAFNQMQVDPAIDLCFANGVRALLRQDPDIIMIGEIRDLETAQMAIQAALTGHLVLSTLHTNDACTAIGRLLELGIPHYLIRTTLIGVMAQRLIRTLCPACKVPATLSEQDWHTLVQPQQWPLPTEAKQAAGCPACRHTGYRGRTGIHELLPLSESLKPLICADGDAQALRHQALAEGMRSLRLNGAQKVAAGLTSVAEIIRVAP